MKAGGKQSFTMVSCLAYSFALKMEVTFSSKTSVDFHWTTWRYIPDDRVLHNHHCETLKSYINNFPTYILEVQFCITTVINSTHFLITITQGRRKNSFSNYILWLYSVENGKQNLIKIILGLLLRKIHFLFWSSHSHYINNHRAHIWDTKENKIWCTI
jgi:hypothetical protein